MRLLGKNHLISFAAKYSDSRSALSVWEHEVEAIAWASPADLKQRYPSASLVGKDNVVFNIGGNKYRLHARVNYATGIVIVVRIGTHREYDKWVF